MRYPSVAVGHELAHEMDGWADQAWRLLEAWGTVSESMTVAPDGSPRAIDLRAWNQISDPEAESMAVLPGWLSTSYVGAMGQHLAAIASLLENRRVIVALWPLLRAQLELAGRVSWLLEPREEAALVGINQRVHRALMERRLDWLRRAEREKAMREPDHEEEARKRADTIREDMLRLDNEASVEWNGFGSLRAWVSGGEDYLQFRAAARIFCQAQLGDPLWLYDLLANLAHPSELEMSSQTVDSVSDSGRRRDFVVGREVLEWQAKLACVMFYRASHYVIGYFGVSDRPIEDWADQAPNGWLGTAA